MRLMSECERSIANDAVRTSSIGSAVRGARHIAMASEDRFRSRLELISFVNPTPNNLSMGRATHRFHGDQLHRLGNPVKPHFYCLPMPHFEIKRTGVLQHDVPKS
jgi:hypothetical protein